MMMLLRALPAPIRAPRVSSAPGVRRTARLAGLAGLLASALVLAQSTPQCGQFNYCLGSNCSYTSADQACTVAALGAHPGSQVHIDTDQQNGQTSWSCAYTFTNVSGGGTDAVSGPVQPIASSCDGGQTQPPPPPTFSLPHCAPSTSPAMYCVLVPLNAGA